MATPGPSYRGWHYDKENDRLEMYKGATKAFHVDNCGNVAFQGNVSASGAAFTSASSSLTIAGAGSCCAPAFGVLGVACECCVLHVTFTAS